MNPQNTLLKQPKQSYNSPELQSNSDTYQKAKLFGSPELQSNSDTYQNLQTLSGESKKLQTPSAELLFDMVHPHTKGKSLIHNIMY